MEVRFLSGIVGAKGSVIRRSSFLIRQNLVSDDEFAEILVANGVTRMFWKALQLPVKGVGDFALRSLG
jgi:hypothetical protein